MIKVICINKDFSSSWNKEIVDLLNIGKVYNVENDIAEVYNSDKKDFESEMVYRIALLYRGHYIHVNYPVKYFITLAEYREQQMKSILDEE